jgi:hypothetical protein
MKKHDYLQVESISSTKCSTYQSLMIGFKGFGYKKEALSLMFFKAPVSWVYIRMEWNVDDFVPNKLATPLLPIHCQNHLSSTNLIPH